KAAGAPGDGHAHDGGHEKRVGQGRVGRAAAHQYRLRHQRRHQSGRQQAQPCLQDGRQGPVGQKRERHDPRQVRNGRHAQDDQEIASVDGAVHRLRITPAAAAIVAAAITLQPPRNFPPPAAINAAITATARLVRSRSWPTNRPMNMAGRAKSSPSASGAARAPPTHAPATVESNQLKYAVKARPVNSAGSPCPRRLNSPWLTAKVSSVIKKPRAARTPGRTPRKKGLSAALIRTCLRFTRNVMATIDRPGAPASSRATATNWLAPAYTSADMAPVSKGERPMLAASTPMARPIGTYPITTGQASRMPCQKRWRTEPALAAVVFCTGPAMAAANPTPDLSGACAGTGSRRGWTASRSEASPTGPRRSPSRRRAACRTPAPAGSPRPSCGLPRRRPRAAPAGAGNAPAGPPGRSARRTRWRLPSR